MLSTVLRTQQARSMAMKKGMRRRRWWWWRVERELVLQVWRVEREILLEMRVEAEEWQEMMTMNVAVMACSLLLMEEQLIRRESQAVACRLERLYQWLLLLAERALAFLHRRLLQQLSQAMAPPRCRSQSRQQHPPVVVDVHEIELEEIVKETDLP